MIRLLLLVALSATIVQCADHTIFKDCTRIPFCKALRNNSLEQKYQFSADTPHAVMKDNIVTVPLKNQNGQSLNLQITLLDGNKARIKILEPVHDRYELRDVLDNEPKILPIILSSVNKKYLNIQASDALSKSKVLVYPGTPFKMEFYYGDMVQVVLKGNRFVMQSAKPNQAFAFEVEFPAAKKLYGLHHHAFDLELITTSNTTTDPFRLRNSDNANYEVGSPMALYGAVPALYGYSADSTSGIFLHNAAEQWVDTSVPSVSTPSAYFMVESGTFDMFVMLGPDIKSLVRQFTELTGRAHMPQLWTLGYHQCRWSYMSQDKVKEVVQSMDKNDFPMDAIWLDIDHTDGKRYFTWNKETFGDPIGLQHNLSSTNRKLVTISDPHIKIDDNYNVYSQAKGKFFVKNAQSEEFQGDCWPGQSKWIDFLNLEARKYYSEWYSYARYNGSTETLAGIWNDMNEPSVFDNSIEKTLPFDVLHFDGIHKNGVEHRDIHNIYGFLQTMATHQGLLDRDNNRKRPFVLTRSHFAGSQRYAAMWTGDNTADWPYMKVSYSECLLSGLQGMVFCGADIGGFSGDPDDELLQRWYQAGVWLPFYRGHSDNNSKNREPYNFNENVQNNIRHAMKLRYKHIPVWYTLFYEHTRTGDPIVRPLFYEFPGTVGYNDQLLLGKDILVAPVMEKGVKQRQVIFPGNELWYRIDDDSWKVYKGPNTKTFNVDMSTSPFFYRGGSIIVRKDLERPSTTDGLNDSYTIYVNLDNDGNASGTLYIDDFESFDYRDKSMFYYVRLDFIRESKGLRITPLDNGNSDDFTVMIKQLVIHDKTGLDEYKRTIINETHAGTPLSQINLAKLHRETKILLNLNM